MRPRRDSTGSVIDINDNTCERFLELISNLKEKDSKVDFIAERCTHLPEIIEEGGD